MRASLALILAVVLCAPAAAARPQLIGTDGTRPITGLDADLAATGKLRLPRATDGTVLSPDGRRVATWAFDPGTVSIRDASTGAVKRRLKTDVGPDVYWPTAQHVLTFGYEPGRVPNTVRSFDLKRGTVRVQHIKGYPRDTQVVGGVTRFLVVGGAPEPPHGGFTEYDIGAAGRIKRTFKVPLAKGMDSYAAVSFLGDKLLASEEGKHVLIDRDGTLTPLDLPDGYWYVLGDDLITSNGMVIRIDPETGALGKRVDVGPDAGLTPYAGGFIVGLGRARYDANLDLVAENPAAPTVPHGPLVVSGDRFYALTFTCDDGDPYFGYRLLIGDARTGATLDQRPGSAFKLGLLGSGYLPLQSYDDDCD